MLKTDPDSLWKEVRYAEKERDRRCAVLKSIVKGIHSPFFTSGEGDTSSEVDYNPESGPFRFVRQMVPQMVMTNPRVRLGSRVFGAEGIVGELKQAVDQWVIDNDYAAKLDPSAYDMLELWAFSMVTLEEHPHLELEDGSPALIPRRKRIPQRHAIIDPLALEPGDEEYIGHQWTAVKEDLIQRAKDYPDEGWILKELEGLAENTGIGDVKTRRAADDAPDRDEVVLYDLWLRNAKMPEGEGHKEGFHGMIYTMAVGDGSEGAKESDARMVRDARPFYGPADGPYVRGGVYYVIDDAFKLSPLVATEGQNRDLNRHARAVSDSAARYKRLILVDNTDPNFVGKIKSGEHDLVLPISGLEKNQVVQVEIGGITAQNLEYLALASDRYDRNLGMDQINQGNVQGQATATEVAEAAQATDLATDYVKLQFHRMVVQELLRVLWYYFDSPKTRIALGPEVAEALGAEAVPGEAFVFAGGMAVVPDPETGEPVQVPYKDIIDFAELALEIEPMSMERSSEGINQARTMTAMQIAAQYGPTMPMAPWINWPELMNKVGDANNIPDLGSMFDFEMIQAVGMAMLQGGEGGPAGSPSPVPTGGGGGNTAPPSRNGGAPKLGQQTGAQLGGMMR